MKKAIIISLISLIVVWFNACDVIEPPYQEEGTVVWNGRKVLLLDFTATRCNNCPNGHRVIQNLQNTYGEAVVPIAVHCGLLSIPTGDNETEEYYYDFRTDIGNQLGGDGETTAGDLNVLAQPIGVVGVLDEDNLKVPGAWSTEVAQLISAFPQYDVEIENVFIENDSIIHTTITVNSLTNNTSNLYLTVYITESHIIQWQKDSEAEPEEDVADYEHNHVLRGGFNGAWGESIGQGMGVEKTYEVKIGADWVPENCSVVAFVYDSETKEVLQAEEAHFIE